MRKDKDLEPHLPTRLVNVPLVDFEDYPKLCGISIQK